MFEEEYKVFDKGRVKIFCRNYKSILEENDSETEREGEGIEKSEQETQKWVCKCLVCGEKWSYDINVKEDQIRARCAPCGHQGVFEVKKGKYSKCPTCGTTILTTGKEQENG